MKVFTVILKKQHPAWDEVDGINLGEFLARGKREALNLARRAAEDADHAGPGCGRTWLSAKENE